MNEKLLRIARRLAVLITAATLSWAMTACVQGVGEEDGEGEGDATGGSACDRVKRLVVDCYDDFCNGDGKSSPFCSCWSQGLDIETQSCRCIARRMSEICQITDEESFVCSRAEGAAESICR
jgi:hypothetical protein